MAKAIPAAATVVNRIRLAFPPKSKLSRIIFDMGSEGYAFATMMADSASAEHQKQV